MAEPRPARQWLRLGLGLVISAGALYLALRKTSLAEVGHALAHFTWWWLPIMAALKVGVLVIKELRWRWELAAMEPGPHPRYRGLFRAIGVGYFGNILLPFRLGELMRVGLYRRHNPGADAAGALATIAAERVLDGAVLSLMVAAVLPFAEVPRWEVRGSLILLAIMGGLFAVSLATPLHRLAMRLLPARGPLAIARKIIDALSRGTAVLRRPRYLAMATLWTAVAWLGEGLVIYAAVRALALPIDFAGALVVTLLLSIGLLIPSAPGQVGTHQALTKLIVRPFGPGDAQAVSLSVVLQVVSIAVLGAIGGWVLWREAGARGLVRAAGAPNPPATTPPASATPPPA